MDKPMNRRDFRPVRRHRTRGVSLMEALVAMAVMAFGMLAVVGVQATLRMNADIAKQRSEATRIAEEEIERLRTFRQVESVAGPVLGWDEIVSQGATVAAMAAANTTYQVIRNVGTPAGSAQKTLSVTVNWEDRYGNVQNVVLRNVIAGAAPVLSGLLSAAPTRTAPSQRKNRHPTIPLRAHELGTGESVFKPAEGGTVAWIFNDVTGVITSVCTVAAASTSSSLTVADLTACTTTAAQLLSGNVVFNLRGASKDFGNGTSVLKPIPGATRAWVIDHGSNSIVRNCDVTAASTTATLTIGDVPAGPSCAGVSQPIAPFDPAIDAGYSLLAVDAENPRWPALPLTVGLALTSVGHADTPQCVADAPTTSIQSNGRHSIEYFCIVFPNASKTWSGKSVLVEAAFGDGGAAAWSVGTAVGAFRICRFTRANVAVTDNADHPLNYASVAGNLINQNFLVIAGPKNCPTDVAANPAAGDLVNSNTLQHQP